MGAWVASLERLGNPMKLLASVCVLLARYEHVNRGIPDILQSSRISLRSGRAYEKEVSVAADCKQCIPKCLESLLAGAAVTTHEKPSRRGVLHERRGWLRG